MNWGIIIVIGIIVALVIALILARWYYKRRKRLKYSQIPLEMLEDFEIAERRLKEDKDGKTNPHKILWEIARRREQRGRDVYHAEIAASQRDKAEYGEVTGREQADGYAELSDEPQRREPVQAGVVKADRTVKRKPKRNWAKFD